MAFLFLLISCASTKQDNFPEFQTSSDIIAKAKKEFRKSNNDFLSILLVNREGKVVKVKKLASKLDDVRHNIVVAKSMYDVQFKKTSPDDAPYREFILPYRAEGSSNNDPTETTLRGYSPQDYDEKGYY